MSVFFFKSEFAIVSTVSSAYRVVLQFLQCGKSYKPKKKGPSMLPCGTPVFTDNIEEARLSREVYCLRLVKYELKRSNATPRMP